MLQTTRNNKIKTLSSSWMKEFLPKNVNVNGSKVFTVVLTNFMVTFLKTLKAVYNILSSLNFCGRAKTLVLLNHRHVPWGRRSCRIDFDPLTFPFFGQIRIVQLDDNVLILLFLVTYNNKKYLPKKNKIITCWISNNAIFYSTTLHCYYLF